jgi:hypothetical protein
MYKNVRSFIYSGLLMGLAVCASILLVSLGVVGLGYGLHTLFSLSFFQGVIVSLMVTCFSGLTLSIVFLARNLKKTVEHFSVLQLEDSEEPEGEDYEEYNEDYDIYDDEKDLNEFLRKISKSRQSATRNDLCPCGSGLKLKDCCGAL